MLKQNFYHQKLNQIITLIDQKKYRKALDLINQELLMPYIPEKFELQFKELRVQASMALKPDNIIYDISLEGVEQILFKDGSLNSIMALMFKLKKLNIVQFLKPIKKYLVDKKADNMAKSIIIYALKEANVAGKFNIVKNNYKMSFEPTKIIETNQMAGFAQGQKMINMKFKQEVNKLNMAQQIYFTSLFKIAPFAFSSAFAQKQALKAIEKVNKAFA